MSKNKEIELYTSNWLYNAGVIGFLNCLDRKDYLFSFNDKRYNFRDDGSININNSIFDSINVDDNYFKNGKVVNLVGNNKYYPNFLQDNDAEKAFFKRYVNCLSKNLNNNSCSLCNDGKFITDDNSNEIFSKFLTKWQYYDKWHNRSLGPSRLFPNAYWNNYDNDKTKTKICHLCVFIIIHHHLAFAELSDGSEIFINAPTFKVMYELNKIVNEMFGREKVSGNGKRQILAMSVIEYTRRIQTTLGRWAGMNIEIVIKNKKKENPKEREIDFYNLPYETVQLISDRKIAGLLSDIGEFSILDAVLDGNEEQLLNIAYSIIRISMKDNINKGDSKFINDYLKIWKNKNKLNETAQKILDLYINIKERRSFYV
ncbi:MAG: hypothetical protein KBG82_08545 [Spirochaetes bacterium]|nr:hypothetical protein [Spirochaetota bacterium]